jgi:hypothetical protein
MKGIHLIISQHPRLQALEEAHIVAWAGAERLDCDCVFALGAQVIEQQRGEDGFARTGVGAGDEVRACGALHFQ